MKKHLKKLILIRRITLAVLGLLFVVSAIGVFTYSNGSWGDPELSLVGSINGTVFYLDRHTIGSPAPDFPWHARLMLYSDPRLAGVSFGDLFHWQTLGFRRISATNPGLPNQPPISVSALVVPYWPFLLALLLPEIVGWVRRARAKTLNYLPDIRVADQRVEGDLPCIQCGYNLRTLQSTGRCPECGWPIAGSIELDAELSKSQPRWLWSLVIGCVLLFLSRVLLLVAYALTFDRHLLLAQHYLLVGPCFVGVSLFYAIGTIFLTRPQNPHRPAPRSAIMSSQRKIAVASLILTSLGAAYQAFQSAVRTLPFRIFGVLRIDWAWQAVFLLLLGWLLYSICVASECRVLARLGERLFDNSLIEHCAIAGLGGCASNLLVLMAIPATINAFAIPTSPQTFWPLFVILLLWLLFVVWLMLLNLYCVVRFAHQARLASVRWRRLAEFAPGI